MESLMASLRWLLLVTSLPLLLELAVSQKGMAADRESSVPGNADADRMARLITQLGSWEFAKREEATKALDALELAALTALRKAASTSEDAEVRRRATLLVEATENRWVKESDFARKMVDLCQLIS